MIKVLHHLPDGSNPKQNLKETNQANCFSVASAYEHNSQRTQTRVNGSGKKNEKGKKGLEIWD